MSDEKTLKVIPYGKRILVRLSSKEVVTESGILLIHNEKQRADTGTIVSVGAGVEDTGVKAGQKVLFEQYSGVEVMLAEEKHVVLELEHIVGFLNEA